MKSFDLSDKAKMNFKHAEELHDFTRDSFRFLEAGMIDLTTHLKIVHCNDILKAKKILKKALNNHV